MQDTSGDYTSSVYIDEIFDDGRTAELRQRRQRVRRLVILKVQDDRAGFHEDYNELPEPSQTDFLESLEDVSELVSSENFPLLHDFVVAVDPIISLNEAKLLVQILNSAPSTPKKLAIQSPLLLDGFQYIFSQFSNDKSSTMFVDHVVLTKVDFSHEALSCLTMMLFQNTCIRTLDIIGSPAGHLVVQAVAKALSINNSLRSLSLNLLYFGNNGLLALADILPKNNGLETLNLAANSLGFRNAAAHGMQSFLQSVNRSNTLKVLNLLDNEFSNDLVPTFVNTLQDKASPMRILLSLNLLENSSATILSNMKSPRVSLELDIKQINSYALSVLAKGIMRGTCNVGLLKVDLSGHTTTVKTLFEILATNDNNNDDGDNTTSTSTCPLKSLHVADSGEALNSFLMTDIATLLPQTNLECLQLESNGDVVGNIAVQQIINCLNNTQLKGLHLVHFGMNDTTRTELFRVLRNNTKIITLDIYDDNITTFNIQELFETVKNFNTTLCNVSFPGTLDAVSKTLIDGLKFYLSLNSRHRRDILNPNLIRYALYPYLFQSIYSNHSEMYWLLRTCPQVFESCRKRKKKSTT